MLKRLLLLCLVVIASQAIPISVALQEKWNEFKIQYRKNYSSHEEELHRMKIFMKNKILVTDHNKKFDNGDVAYRLGLGKFADKSHEDFRSKNSGHNRFGGSLRKAVCYPPGPSRKDVPDAVDWRQEGAVTPVKDSGDCTESSWTFSATGAIEAQQFKLTKTLVSLSEQNLLDCSGDYGNFGCNGGDPGIAMTYVYTNDGIDTEESYPYEAKVSECRFNASNVGAILDAVCVIDKGDLTSLKEAVANTGPVSVGVFTNVDSFRLYESGVYDDSACTGDVKDHFVLLVGYGSENGTDYWIAKNCWGEDWGEDGYIRIAAKDNICGIGQFAVYPTVPTL